MPTVMQAKIVLNGVVVLDAKGGTDAVFAALRAALGDLEVTPADTLTIIMRAL